MADQSSAVVPQAKVILKDSQSGSQRDSVTNSDGYFTFASVPASEYELTIEAKGFSTFKVTGITLSGGEKRNIDAKLTVGTTSEAVEVTGEVDKVAPVDSAEKTNLITSKELQNFVQVGSNAAEFIKIMPGFGITNGTNNAANYNGQTIGINANWRCRQPEPAERRILLQWFAWQLVGYHRGWRARVRPGLQLRYASESQLGHDLRDPGEDVEFRRFQPEGSGGDHFGGQVRRQGLSWLGLSMPVTMS